MTHEPRTTNADRLEFLRLWKGSLEAYIAEGKDIADVLRDINKAIARRERKELLR